MNRVIKFRIWDYENQEMIEWDKIKNKGFYASMMVLWDGLCQFTGLRDKNGKDIYEGDILKYEVLGATLFWQVIWDSENGSWKITKENGGSDGSWFNLYEVAGNIFENSDLLS